MDLKDWAKRAREVLGNYWFDSVEDGEYVEEFNNEEVIKLCNEYDENFKD